MTTFPPLDGVLSTSRSSIVGPVPPTRTITSYDSPNPDEMVLSGTTPSESAANSSAGIDPAGRTIGQTVAAILDCSYEDSHEPSKSVHQFDSALYDATERRRLSKRAWEVYEEVRKTRGSSTQSKTSKRKWDFAEGNAWYAYQEAQGAAESAIVGARRLCDEHELQTAFKEDDEECNTLEARKEELEVVSRDAKTYY
jgi:hypothetical protein